VLLNPCTDEALQRFYRSCNARGTGASNSGADNQQEIQRQQQMQQLRERIAREREEQRKQAETEHRKVIQDSQELVQLQQQLLELEEAENTPRENRTDNTESPALKGDSGPGLKGVERTGESNELKGFGSSSSGASSPGRFPVWEQLNCAEQLSVAAQHAAEGGDFRHAKALSLEAFQANGGEAAGDCNQSLIPPPPKGYGQRGRLGESADVQKVRTIILKAMLNNAQWLVASKERATRLAAQETRLAQKEEQARQNLEKRKQSVAALKQQLAQTSGATGGSSQAPAPQAKPKPDPMQEALAALRQAQQAFDGAARDDQSTKNQLAAAQADQDKYNHTLDRDSDLWDRIGKDPALASQLLKQYGGQQ
jgi:cell division protein FtsB